MNEILRATYILKIARLVAGLIQVSVIDLLSWGAGPKKGFGYQTMDQFWVGQVIDV